MISYPSNWLLFQGGLIAGLHAAQSRCHHGHIAGGLPQGCAGGSDGLQDREYLIRYILVRSQSLDHGRQIIGQERRIVGHLHQVFEVLFRNTSVTE